MVDHGFVVFRIGAERVDLAFRRFGSDPFIFDDLAAMSYEILAGFESFVVVEGDIIFLYTLEDEAAGFFLFAEGEAVTFDPVIGRKTLDLHFFIINECSGAADGMELEGEADLGVGDAELHFNDFLQRGRSEDFQFLLVAEEAEGIDEAYQAKIMVTVQVRNEYMRDPAPPDLVIDHLDLGTFPAIDEEVFSVQGDDLAGRVSVKSRDSGIIP
jgi:hypothetical protein